MKPGRIAIVSVVAVCVTVSVGLVVALSQRQDSTRPSASTSTPTLPQGTALDSLVAVQPPAVATLTPGLAVVTHEASSASTEFSLGALQVRFSVDDGTLRWVDSPAPVSGGRLSPSDAEFSSLPANLPVVLSYNAGPDRVSIFGRLATAPSLVSGEVVYSITVFDAPGRDATYTVSGSYDIPEELVAPSLMIAGQLQGD